MTKEEARLYLKRNWKYLISTGQLSTALDRYFKKFGAQEEKTPINPIEVFSESISSVSF